MTEGNEDGPPYLVRVRAQVMVRDDSTGGWVPLGGGGLSNVSVRKRPSATPPQATPLPTTPSPSTVEPAAETNGHGKHDYLIHGKRISDQSVILSCTIKRDFEYNKVMPTFHHWRTGDKKFGLTFQTAADARAFDKGVRMAVEDLLDVMWDSSSLGGRIRPRADVGDDDVFMTLDLPVERGDSRSSSGSSGAGVSHPHSHTHGYPHEGHSGFPHPHANHHHLHRMHFLTRPPSLGSSTNGGSEGERRDYRELGVSASSEEKEVGVVGPMEAYSYVQFAKDRPPRHDYSYPAVGSGDSSSGSKGSLKKPPQALQLHPPPLLPTKSGGKRRKRTKDNPNENKAARARCRHCHEVFCEDSNPRGACEYAPDCVRRGIDMLSCIACAQCMLYHCMADAEGDFAPHPCQCSPADESCGRRWVGLALLSLLVPCLCCYLPLKGCHSCAVACGVCGGTHDATT